MVGSVTNSADATAQIRSLRPHLLLLDLTLRGTDGVTLLRRLRGEGAAAEVIAVTASRRAEVVRSLIHLGVIDYLVKPFTPERFHQALVAFKRRMAAPGSAELSQGQVDGLCNSGSLARRWLPKGLGEPALERVRSALVKEGAPASAGTIADEIGMARVTARRYLEYLVATQQAGCRTEPSGPGRPRKLYWANSD